MTRISVFLLLLVSCGGEGPRLVGHCVDDGVADAVDEVVERWPEVADVADRMDVHCVPRDRIDTFSRCGRSPAEDPEACTMWLGTSPVYRGRMYVVADESLSAFIRHEAQHWHLLLQSDDGCDTHTPDCGWE